MMKTKIIVSAIIAISLVILWLNGRQIANNVSYLAIPEQGQAAPDTLTQHPGKLLLESKCYACHNPTSGHDARLAPPMIAVKYHYKDEDTSLEQFTADIWNFVKQPSQEKTKMRGAVRRFGVMPFQEFDEQEVKLIADYIYNNTIAQPSWFDQHKKDMQKGRE